MADSCLGKVTKYILFISNLLIFLLGIAVLGAAIWVVVSKPSFFDILDNVGDVCGEAGGDTSDCSDMTSTIAIYASATYIMIAISVLAIIISFFGCFGAAKESKCMLGTYFTIVLALFIVMLVGAILAYSGDLEDQIKTPFKKALKKYNDNPESGSPGVAYKNVWNEAQKELMCCGIDSVTDWRQSGVDFVFTNNFNKPEGCCFKDRDGNELTGKALEDCRKSTELNTSTKYYFEGCYTAMENAVTENQEVLVGIAIGVVVSMFLNMLFSFSLCMMVRS